MDPLNIYYLFTVLVLLPAIAVRSARATRAVLASQRDAAPPISRVSIYARVMALQLIYGGFTLYVAVRNEIPLLVPPTSWSVVAIIAIGAVAAKIVLVRWRRDWFRSHTGPAVDGLAPRLRTREFPFFAVLCVTTGLAEEFTYRLVAPTLLGWISFGASFSIDPWLSLAITSLAFAVLHAPQRLRGMLFAGAFGAANQMLAWWTGSIWTAVLSHAAYDLVAGVVIARRRDAAIRTGGR